MQGLRRAAKGTFCKQGHHLDRAVDFLFDQLEVLGRGTMQNEARNLLPESEASRVADSQA